MKQIIYFKASMIGIQVIVALFLVYPWYLISYGNFFVYQNFLSKIKDNFFYKKGIDNLDLCKVDYRIPIWMTIFGFGAGIIVLFSFLQAELRI
jgi:hypothetical protein